MPYWRLFYHVVWGTKNRLALIDPAWEKELHGYIRGKATALECIPHAIGGMPDHMHVVISIPPKLALATVIGQLKGASSHHVNQKYTGGSKPAFPFLVSVVTPVQAVLTTALPLTVSLIAARSWQ